MMKRTVLAHLGLAAIAMTAISPLSGAAAGTSPADGFSQGGTYCFELGAQEPNQFQHLRLVTEPAGGAAPYNVIPVHAVERGSWKGHIYVNTFTGTATQAPSADPKAPGPALLMTLDGGGNSYKPDGSPEIWHVQYALELNTDTLAGKIVGYETETGAIANGKPFTADSVTFVEKPVTPIDCSAF